ncbi:MAG: SPOR domain-containing protein [Chlorobiaceae bacterium]|nr:SPOR domain-containing protein [Chlorobiaceae bacterium]
MGLSRLTGFALIAALLSASYANKLPLNAAETSYAPEILQYVSEDKVYLLETLRQKVTKPSEKIVLHALLSEDGAQAVSLYQKQLREYPDPSLDALSSSRVAAYQSALNQQITLPPLAGNFSKPPLPSGSTITGIKKEVKNTAASKPIPSTLAANSPAETRSITPPLAVSDLQTKTVPPVALAENIKPEPQATVDTPDKPGGSALAANQLELNRQIKLPPLIRDIPQEPSGTAAAKSNKKTSLKTPPASAGKSASSAPSVNQLAMNTLSSLPPAAPVVPPVGTPMVKPASSKLAPNQLALNRKIKLPPLERDFPLEPSPAAELKSTNKTSIKTIAVSTGQNKPDSSKPATNLTDHKPPTTVAIATPAALSDTNRKAAIKENNKPGTPSALNPATSNSGLYAIQFGFFRTRKNAEGLLEKISINYPAIIADKGETHKVLLKKTYPSKKEALSAARTIPFTSIVVPVD